MKQGDLVRVEDASSLGSDGCRRVGGDLSEMGVILTVDARRGCGRSYARVDVFFPDGTTRTYEDFQLEVISASG